MDALLKEVAARFGLGPIDSAERVERGFMSENHVLTAAGQKYFLKRYRFTEPDRVVSAHAAKAHFAAGGFPVIMPLAAKNGTTFFERGGSYYALFSFVVGRQIEGAALSPTAIIALGQTLGQLHRRGRTARLPARIYERPLDTTAALNHIDRLLSKIEAVPAPTEFDRLAQAQLLTKKRLLTAAPPATAGREPADDHLLHGDFTSANVFFDGQDQLQAVFDFERTGYGPRLQELFRSLTYSLMRTGDEADLPARARLYLEAYRDAYPMTDDEVVASARFFRRRYLHNVWIISEHYDFANPRTDALLPVTDAILKLYTDGLDEFLDAILS